MNYLGKALLAQPELVSEIRDRAKMLDEEEARELAVMGECTFCRASLSVCAWNCTWAQAKEQLVCNGREREEDGNWCNADDGNPCPKCEKERQAEADYWLGQWKAASPEEKLGREEYDAQLRDAGRLP